MKSSRQPTPAKFPAEIDDREVPAYAPATGQSANDAAKTLGWRLLSRAEARDSVLRAAVLGAIKEGGLTFWGVAA